MIIIFFIVSVVAQAENYRLTKPKAWQAEKSADAIKLLYGTNITQEDNRTIVTAPKLAENGGSIPITISTTIPAKSIAVLQDANPRALTVVFSVNDNPQPNYSVRIKMRQTAYLTVIVEGLDGILYSHIQEIDVSIGGCGCSSAPTPYVKKSKVAVGASINSRVSRVSYFTPTMPVPSPQVERERYSSFNENTFKEVASSPLSTFSSDVDTASYSNVRSYIMDRKALPSKDAVRSEEMINYFNYSYAEPTDDKPFAVNTTVGHSIWNKKTKIIQIGLQTKTVNIEALPASNLVFLLDVSGSMHRPESLPLLSKSLKLL